LQDEARAQYVRYKAEQAREMWQEAECLYTAGKFRGCISRAYFAFYKAAVAALVARGENIADKEPRHVQAVGRFNKLFVRSGMFPRELGRFLNDLEDLRVRADYRDQAILVEEAEEVITRGRQYLDQIHQFIETSLAPAGKQDLGKDV